MNSTEDILQEIFMRDRNTVYNVATAPSQRLHGIKKLFRYIKVWIYYPRWSGFGPRSSVSEVY